MSVQNQLPAFGLSVDKPCPLCGASYAHYEWCPSYSRSMSHTWDNAEDSIKEHAVEVTTFSPFEQRLLDEGLEFHKNVLARALKR